jgi:DNA-binding SARP family transcriptional activator/tetratricopeptide (TPR) repeat protein
VLRIETLGGPVFRSGTTAVDLKSKKHAGLLVFLACQDGKRVSRDVVTEMFWTSFDHAKARHSISQAVYSLRKELPSLCLELQRDYLHLPSGTVSVDIAELRHAMGKNDLQDVRRLDVADFLDGFWINGCPYFSEWQERARSELRSDLVGFYRRCTRDAEQAGEWSRVSIAAEGLVRIEPYDEPSYQALIRACIKRGEASQAARWLERVEQRITVDLSQALAPETAALRESLRSFELSILSVDDDNPAQTGPFVGRASQFAELTELLDAAAAGAGQAAVVIGEAGIGKTRLCQRLLRFAALRGAKVLQGACYESEQQLPFNGIVDALRDSVTLRELVNVAQPWRDIISEMSPETLQGERSFVLDASPEAQARRFEAIVQLLFSLSATQTVALLVEDIHWASPSTVALLSYVVRRTSEARVLIIASLRPGEFSGERARIPLISPTGRFRNITVGPLEREDALTLIDAVQRHTKNHLDPKTISIIIDRIGGRPFLLLEFVRELLQNNLSKLDTEALPDSIRSYLGDALLRVSPFAVFIAQCLSVADKPLSLTSLAAVAGSSLSDVFRAIEELERRSLVQRVSQGVRLVHDIFRQFIYGALQEDGRRAIHRAIAEALESAPDTRPGLLAFHFDKAGVAGQALKFALRAITEAQMLDSGSDAEESFRIAIRSASPYDCAPTLQLAEMLIQKGRTSEAESLLLTVRMQLAHLGDTREKLLTEVELLRIPRNVTNATLDELESLIRRADDLGDIDSMISACQLFAESCYSSGQENRVATSMRRLVRLSSMHATKSRTAVRGMLSAARFAALTGDALNGLKLAEHVLTRGRALNSPELILGALAARGLNQLQLGRLAAANATFHDAYAIGAEKCLFYSQWSVLNSYGVVLIEVGEYARCEQVLEQAALIAEHMRTYHYIVFARINLSLLYFEQGRLKDAKDAALLVLTFEPSSSSWWNRVLALSVLGLISLSQNDLDIARDYGRQVTKALAETEDRTPDLSYVHIFLTRLQHNSQPTAALEALDTAIKGYGKRDPCCVLRLSLERARVLVSIRASNAIEECEAVAARAERMGAEPIRARAQELLRTI